jgi:hypothetical protein
MSNLFSGQSERDGVTAAMSALLPRADIRRRHRDVSFVPKRDMRSRLGDVRSYFDIRHWSGYLWAIRQNPTIDTFEALGNSVAHTGKATGAL